MITWLLEEIDRNSTSVFRKKDLLQKSEEEFAELKQLGLFKYIQPDLYHETYPCDISCECSCPMEIIEIGGKLFAICPDNPEIDPVAFEKTDLHRYEFSVEEFLRKIKSANDISGNLEKLSTGLWYLGNKKYGNMTVGFVFMLKVDDVILKVSGIKTVCNDDALVMLTPISKIDMLELVGYRILNVPLIESLDTDTFQLDFNISKLAIQDNGLTEQQRLDYERFGYKCYDKIRIPQQEPKNRSYMIYVNDKPVRLGESLFNLLMRFIEELKKDEGGWTNTHTLYEAGIISDPDKYQIYSELRGKLEGKMLVGTGIDLIESDGSKNYRLSVHPDFCSC